MELRCAESGTFWVVDLGNGLPPLCPAQVETEFEEISDNGVGDLAAAMNLPSPESVRRRMQHGRRCFVLRVAGQIAAYGWITLGPERVGELEREFNLHEDEAYIWDCGTVPAWRQRRLYSGLLSQIVHQLRTEEVPRIWIGASRQNQPSIRGIENAGFEHVLDLVYQRFYRLVVLKFQESPSIPPELASAAYSILLTRYERRVGRLAVGWYPH
jgi:ribosomal protein S18 acetylase RimI-like enzyme